MLDRGARSSQAADSAAGRISSEDMGAVAGEGDVSWNAIVVAFGALSGTLLAVGGKDYPNLHTILDTGTCLLSGVLALLLWDAGVRIGRLFPRLIAIAFAATALLEFVHVVITIEWSGPLAAVAASRSFLRPATWPPSAHLLPIGIWGAVWLRHRGLGGVAGYAAAIVGLAAVLLTGFEWLPTYAPAGVLWITRPAL